MQQLVSGIQYNDMLRPLKLLSTELIKRKTKSGTVVKHHGIYRELLFLTFVAIDRENIDQGNLFQSIPSENSENLNLIDCGCANGYCRWLIYWFFFL